MYGRIRLYDYRCFHREAPATIELGPGMTALIGQNNAGKSAAIKAIYELRSVFTHLSAIDQDPYLANRLFGWQKYAPMLDHAEIISERNLPKTKIEIEIDSEEENQIKKLQVDFSHNASTCKPQVIVDGEHELSAMHIKGHLCLVDKNRKIYSAKQISVFFKSLSDCAYFGPFRNATSEGSGSHFDCDIGTEFIEKWHKLKLGGSKLGTRLIQRATEDIREILDVNSLEINAATELKTLQVVIDGTPQMLQELGAGLSQLIVVFLNSLIKQPSFILIDEPELHLHPSLQISFLSKLAKYASGGVIYSTHSMGLARLADRCFTVQRGGKRSVIRPYEKTHNLTEFLGSLGIAGLLDIGWNRILLVEGPKDVRTAQQILKLYEKDRHTIVLPLGGDGMVNGNVGHELAEICRLCPSGPQSIAALVDSERNSEDGKPIKARIGFEKICSDLGIRCCVTERRAIENYISQSAISVTWPSHEYREIAPYEAPENNDSFWGKSETWRAVLNMTREDFDKTDLGSFFASL